MKYNIFTLSLVLLFPSIALANNTASTTVKISDGVSIEQHLSNQSTIDKMMTSNAFSFEIPPGLTASIYSESNFQGVKSVLKGGKYSDVYFKSLIIEPTISDIADFAIQYNVDLPNEEKSCIEVHFNDNDAVTDTGYTSLGTLCSGENKNILAMIPEEKLRGKDIGFAIQEVKENSPPDHFDYLNVIVWLDVTINSDGTTRIKSADRNVINDWEQRHSYHTMVDGIENGLKINHSKELKYDYLEGHYKG